MSTRIYPCDVTRTCARCGMRIKAGDSMRMEITKSPDGSRSFVSTHKECK